eukprot:s2782_g4.t1
MSFFEVTKHLQEQQASEDVLKTRATKSSRKFSDARDFSGAEADVPQSLRIVAVCRPVQLCILRRPEKNMCHFCHHLRFGAGSVTTLRQDQPRFNCPPWAETENRCMGCGASSGQKYAPDHSAVLLVPPSEVQGP